MSVAALFRLTPVYDARIANDPKLARSVMVQRGALDTISRDGVIPVVIDHANPREEANVIGRVVELYIAPDMNGGVVRDWYFASARARSSSLLVQAEQRSLVESHSAQNAGRQRDDPPAAWAHHRGIRLEPERSARRVDGSRCPGGRRTFTGSG